MKPKSVDFFREEFTEFGWTRLLYDLGIIEGDITFRDEMNAKAKEKHIGVIHILADEKFEAIPDDVLYECSLSFAYDAENPVDAAKQFIANIQANPNWTISVKNTETGKKFSVDTETNEVESSLEFDDKVEDKEYGDWAYLCRDHAEEVNNSRLSQEHEPPANTICSVKGCNKEAIFYYLLPKPEIEILRKALEAVYSDIELQNVEGGSDELNFQVQKALGYL